MEFNSSDAVFSEGTTFVDETAVFAGENGAFQGEIKKTSGEASSAFEKNETDATEVHKRAVEQAEQDELVLETGESGTQTGVEREMEKAPSQPQQKVETKSDGTLEVTDAEENESKQSSGEDKKKKAKAAKALAVLDHLRDVRKKATNDLSGNGQSEDAVENSKNGVVGIALKYLNPLTYIKMLFNMLMTALAPFILMGLGIAAVVVVIVMFFMCLAEPFLELKEAVTNFFSGFTTAEVRVIDEPLGEEAYASLLSSLSVPTERQAVVEYALGKLGCSFSESPGDSETTFNSSSLAYYAWQTAGVDLGFDTGMPADAASMADLAEVYGKSIEVSEITPGDLIFYGGKANGKYMGIYRVSIYIGSGLSVDAGSGYGVSLHKTDTDKIVMIVCPDKE